MRRLVLLFVVIMWSRDALSGGRSDYLIHCGGCHSADGASAVATVPDLRKCLEFYLRTDEGRAALLALPGLRAALIRDDARLAEMLNYIAENVEGSLTKADITAAQIAKARTDLGSQRAKESSSGAKQC